MAKKQKRQSKARPATKAKATVKAKAKTQAKKVGKAGKAAKAAKPAAAPAKGLQHIAPGFTANDAAASIKWYCDVLGFTVKERWEHEGVFLGGSLVNGQVAVNIGQDDWKLGRDRVKGQGVRIYITTTGDVDAYAKAIASKGGKLDHEPKDDWGFRAFSITDPDGYKITVMKPLK